MEGETFEEALRQYVTEHPCAKEATLRDAHRRDVEAAAAEAYTQGRYVRLANAVEAAREAGRREAWREAIVLARRLDLRHLIEEFESRAGGK